MIPFSVREASQACLGELHHIADDTMIRGIATDSRLIHSGDLFFALKGDRFDAHQFLTPSLVANITCAVVNRRLLPDGLPDFPFIDVPDVREALGRVAYGYRQSFRMPVIGITGSNGKTSTKALLKAAMSQDREVLASPASFNNDVGVPLTLLDMDAKHAAAILEIGTNHPGEIAHLTRMVEPSMGVITSVGGSHVGHFGSVEAIAQEKGWLAELMPADGTLFLNADSPWYEACAQRTSAQIVRVGFSETADWRLDACLVRADRTECSIQHRGHGIQTTFQIPVPGRHQALNAGLAFAVAFQNGVSVDPILLGLKHAEMPSMRMQSVIHERFTLWNDAYNANEDSVLAALDTFAAVTSSSHRKVVVLGDLNELGSQAEQVYQRLALATHRFGFDLLVGIGQGPQAWLHALQQQGEQRCLAFENVQEAAEKLPSHLQQGDQLLLKASRGARLEKLGEALRTDPAQAKGLNQPQAKISPAHSGGSGQTLHRVLAGSISTGLGGMLT